MNSTLYESFSIVIALESAFSSFFPLEVEKRLTWSETYIFELLLLVVCFII